MIPKPFSDLEYQESYTRHFNLGRSSAFIAHVFYAKNDSLAFGGPAFANNV